MAKITDLPEAGHLDGSEAVPIVKGGVTRRATLGGVVAAVATSAVSQAEAAAADAKSSASTAEGLVGRVYPSRAAGEAATTLGQLFRVSNGDIPRTYAYFERTESGSVQADDLATTAALAAPSAPSRLGSRDGSLSNTLDAIRAAPIVGADQTDDVAAADANSVYTQAAVSAFDGRDISTRGKVRLKTSQYVAPFRQQGFDYYTAALISQSDVSFGGASFHAKGRGVAGTYVEPMFATPRNSAAGTLRGISFVGTRFDLSDDGNSSSNQRAMHLTCTDDLRLIGTVCHNSGARRGYFGHFDNCRDVLISAHHHKKATGGLNFRYLAGMSMAGGLFSDFSEAIDFDGIAHTMSLSSLVFRSSNAERDDQCIDFNSVYNTVASGIVADSVGNVYTINYKDTTQPTYEDFLNGLPPSSNTPSRNIVVNGVTAFRAGSANIPAVIIGTDFSEEKPEGPVKRLILDNHILEQTGYIAVTGAGDLTLSNWLLRDITSPASSSFAAISCRQDEFATGTNFAVEPTFINVTVDHCNRGALLTSGARRLDIDGFRVRNADTSGSGDKAIRLTSVPSGALYTIDRLDVQGDVVINAPADCEIRWGDRNRVTGIVTLQGAAHQALRGVTVPFAFSDLTASGSNQRMRWRAPRKCKVVLGTFSVAVAVPADATNIKTLTFRSIIGGVTSTIAVATSSAGWAANVSLDGGFAVNETAVDLSKGDIIEVAWSHTGTGQAISAPEVQIEVIYL